MRRPSRTHREEIPTMAMVYFGNGRADSDCMDDFNFAHSCYREIHYLNQMPQVEDPGSRTAYEVQFIRSIGDAASIEP